jgi:Putative addiction module component
MKSQLSDSVLKQTDIPDWHKEILNNRSDSFKANPDQSIDFDTAMSNLDQE